MVINAKLMIKYLILIFPFWVHSLAAQVQIPNGDLELWESILNYEEPIGWFTNNDTLHTRLEKDSIAVEGVYSLKFIPTVFSSWEICNSIAGIHVGLSEPLASNSKLVFYAKAIPFDPSLDSTVFLIVVVNVLDSGQIIKTYDWRTNTTLEEFSRIEIPIAGDNIDAINILIYGGASTNPTDGPCIGRSFSWIDDLSIESSTAVEPVTFIEKPNVSIYPNPTSGIVNIHCSEGHIESFELYSIVGALISKGKVENGQLNIQGKGMYVLKLVQSSSKQSVFFKKIIIE